MTREEAIQELAEWIKQMKDHGVPNYSTRYKALKLAIKELQAEPAKHGEGAKNRYGEKRMSKYIDKDKVLEYIIFGVVGKDITCGELARAIENLPTIEVSERTGEWALRPDDYHEYYECDQCGIAIGIDDTRNYCPNCGAKMEGSEGE